MVSRLAEGAFEEAEEEKVCIRGLLRLAMEGWGVGRWVVVRPRDDCDRPTVSYKQVLGTKQQRVVGTYVGVLVDVAVVQQVCVLGHQDRTGIVVEKRADRTSGSSRVERAGELLGDGSGDAGHGD